MPERSEVTVLLSLKGGQGAQSSRNQAARKHGFTISTGTRAANKRAWGEAMEPVITQFPRAPPREAELMEVTRLRAHLPGRASSPPPSAAPNAVGPASRCPSAQRAFTPNPQQSF